jgi:hypothetical protein
MRADKEAVLRAAAGASYFSDGITKYLVLGFLAVYSVVIVTRRSETLAASAETNGVVEYTSPEWLRLPLVTPFDPASLCLHYVCGIALVLSCGIQKHLLPAMAKGKHQSTARFLHRCVFGPIAVLAMIGMAVGGFQMRQDPALPLFSSAMVGFVLPWIVFILVVGPSAYAGAWTVHAVAGEAMFKACVAVPLARVLGAALQRLHVDTLPPAVVAILGETGAAHLEFTDVSGYYTGIGLSAAFTAVWALSDVASFWKRLQRAHARQ